MITSFALMVTLLLMLPRIQFALWAISGLWPAYHPQYPQVLFGRAILNPFVLDGHWFGQAGFVLDEVTQLVSYHFPFFHAPLCSIQEDLFHDLSWHRSEDARLVVPSVVLSTFLKNGLMLSLFLSSGPTGLMNCRHLSS